MKLAFIGFGVAAYGLSKGLKEAGVDEITFFDSNWKTHPFQETIHKRSVQTGARAANSLRELVEKAPIIISCVTGAAALTVAEQAAPHLGTASLYVDVNSTSPMVKEKIAALVKNTGASFVDAAMMGAIPTFLHRVPIFTSGSGATRFKELMEPYQMQITCISEKPGDASALKMLRSIFMKGLTALLMEMLMAARHYDAERLVLDSITKTMEKKSFLDTVQVIFPKGVAAAERMAHEMDDVVETLVSIDTPSELTQAIRDKFLWCRRLRLSEQFAGKIPETIDQTLAAMEESYRRQVAL